MSQLRKNGGYLHASGLQSWQHDHPKTCTSFKDKLHDNIWFQAHFTKEFTGKYDIIKFDEMLFGNDDKKASVMISEHRPLWAEFDVSVDDDLRVLRFCTLY